MPPVSPLTSAATSHLTELQQHLIRSVAGLVVLRERLDAASINGETVNTTDYCRLANATRRVAATLGLARLTRDVMPHPLDYARAYDAEAEELGSASVNILQAIGDPNVFAPSFRDKQTWEAWTAFLAATLPKQTR